MPQLLVFAACRLALTDERGCVTITQIFAEVIVSGKHTGQTDPFCWSAAAIWSPSQEDNGKWFEQRTILLDPKGTKHIGIDTFRMQSPTTLGNVLYSGFPTDAIGNCLLRLYLRPAGARDAWNDISLVKEYPIVVR